MSSIGKILIVVNLILSLAFLGAASSLVAKGGQYRETLEKTSGELKTVTDSKNALETSLKGEINQLRKDVDSMRSEKNRLAGELDAMQNSYNQEKQENAQLRGAVDEIKANLRNYADNNTKLQEQIAAVQSEKDKIRDAKDAAVAAQEKAETEAKDAVVAMRRAQDELANIKDGAELAMKERDAVKAKLEQLVQMTNAPMESLSGQVQIEAQVQDVSDELGLVLLDKGKDDGVQVGYTFDIYQGGAYKGKVMVDNVQAKFSSGKIKLNVSGMKINKGDKATTRL